MTLIEISNKGVYNTFYDREDLIAPYYDIVMKNLVKQIQQKEQVDMYEVFEESKKAQLLDVEGEENKERLFGIILSNANIQNDLFYIATKILPPESVKADLDNYISYEEGKALADAFQQRNSTAYDSKSLQQQSVQVQTQQHQNNHEVELPEEWRKEDIREMLEHIETTDNDKAFRIRCIRTNEAQYSKEYLKNRKIKYKKNNKELNENDEEDKKIIDRMDFAIYLILALDRYNDSGDFIPDSFKDEEINIQKIDKSKIDNMLNCYEIYAKIVQEKIQKGEDINMFEIKNYVKTQYPSIYNKIIDLELFEKFYPGIKSCKCISEWDGKKLAEQGKKPNPPRTYDGSRE